MRVLLTGNEGYLGCLVGPDLLRRGHDVVGLDTGFYQRGWLYHSEAPRPATIMSDIRNITREQLEGFDAVVHLGELSNDPLGQLAPQVTFKVNHEGSVRLATLAKQAGVSRFVYMSSCSVYGVAEGDDVDERSPVNPQTAYAECKALVERDVTALAGDNFTPTFLRNATAYGASPRMRFDIVLNNLSGVAWTAGEVIMTSDGSPWRPLVHGLDISQAIAAVLDAPRDAVHAQIFNVGSSEQNYQVREIAEAVSVAFDNCKLRFGDPAQDNRSYRVRFDKIHEALPTFRCVWDVHAGARELRSVFERVALSRETFESPSFTRLKQLQYLISTGQVDENLFWTPVA